MLGLTEDAQVEWGAGENQVFADNCSLATKKRNGGMCLVPIFFHNSQQEFFSFNGQLFIYFDSLIGKLLTKLSRKFQLTVNGFLLWHYSMSFITPSNLSRTILMIEMMILRVQLNSNNDDGDDDHLNSLFFFT